MPTRNLETSLAPRCSHDVRLGRSAPLAAALAALLGLTAPAAAQAPDAGAAPAPAAAQAPDAGAAPAPPPPAPSGAGAPWSPPPPVASGQRAPWSPSPAAPSGAGAPWGPPPAAGLQGYEPVPPEFAPFVNPRTITYEEGDPIPDGYTLKTRADRALLVPGIVTFAAGYSASLFIASIAALDGNEDEFLPMFIPFAGPVITASMIDAEGAGLFWLSVNAAAQLGGLIMFAAGLAHEDLYLERQVQAAQPMLATGLPRTLPYREDTLQLRGYRLETRPRRGLIIAGTSLLGGAWAVSALGVGTVLSEDDSGSSTYWPLLLPVAGPFLTLGTMHANDDESPVVSLVLLSGLTQAAGLAMIVGGMMVDQKIWVRNDIPRKTSPRSPEVFLGPGGGAVRFTF